MWLVAWFVASERAEDGAAQLRDLVGELAAGLAIVTDDRLAAAQAAGK